MSSKEDMQSISIRRAKLADPDKVRYRVYTSHTEFIAVIADTALMAVRVSGVKAPYKIVRDLPTDGAMIEADKLAAQEESPERIHFTLSDLDLEPVDPQRMTEMSDPQAAEAAPFVPLGITDLQSKGSSRARILPPEMLHEIIESHAKAVAQKQEDVAPSSPAPAAYRPPEEPVVEELAVVDADPEVLPEPMSPEALSDLAKEVLPETPASASAAEEVVLSAEDVQKLLNE